ncbi:MAG: ATP-dependent sacrificial sulfur transferase LarE [Eubacteriales bacterium]|nr:ATP-dependent sacrificial sulfur transferase LarE [Eubacteriales bacterium]
MEEVKKKLELLKAYFDKLESVAVAYSGGVDSTLLLKVAHEVLGERAVAVTVDAINFPRREMKEAVDFCEVNGIRQIHITFDPLELEEFRTNPADRCYHCKKKVFKMIKNEMQGQGIFDIVEGTNVDDIGDYRPGMRAISELGIQSPLREVGLTKAEIRQLSQGYQLDTYNKPSYACLASRFVYGESITKERLAMVEQAEQKLIELGFGNMRVRMHGMMARIEVPVDAFEVVIVHREEICECFKELGFSYVTMDLTGYRTGSMNETL